MAIGDKKSVVMESDRAVNGGIATLDSKGNVPFEQLGNVVRPNLLDNWYFANPVDQRGGWMIAPNTRIYSDSALTQQISVTEKYIAVIGAPTFADGYVAYTNVNGVVRYTEVGQPPIRGYVGGGYTIDRWRTNTITSIIANGGLQLSGSASYWQKIEGYRSVVGKPITFSVLTDDNQLISNTITLAANVAGAFGKTAGANGWYAEMYIGDNDINRNVFELRMNPYGNTLTVIAVKLELGTEQTLAHKDADGNWVLNEIPDYGEELRKCQRYFQKIKTSPLGNGYTSSAGAAAYVEVSTPVTLRATPTLVYDGGVVYRGNGLNVQNVSTEVFSFDNNGVQLLLTNNAIPANESCSCYITDATYCYLDANL